MASDLPILTPSECAKLADIEAKMTRSEWSYTPSGGAPFGYISDGTFIVLGVPYDHYSPEPKRSKDNRQTNQNAIGIVALRNAAPRMLATIAAYEAELKWRRKDAEDWKFVGDDFGGHMLSVPTGDKWYPESFMRKEIDAHEATIAELRNRLTLAMIGEFDGDRR